LGALDFFELPSSGVVAITSSRLVNGKLNIGRDVMAITAKFTAAARS
jgi:hypothetical protein